MQASLFDSPRRSALDDLFADLDGAGDDLRWYQRECVARILDELETHRSTLAVMATGLGKTQVFCNVAKNWDGPVLVLAHREELIQQAKARLEAVVGDYVDVERANEQSSFRSRFVVGSIDSVRQKKRLERMGHDRFALVVIDEAHHGVAVSYRKVLDWFGPAKVLGVTATPDRGDEKALGQAFESVAYVFDIEQGVDDGHLVPLRGRHIDVKEVDVSQVSKAAGDLQVGDLDEVMVNAVVGIVHETLRLEPDRRGVAFFPGVRSAELAAQAFNTQRPGSACFVSGDTPHEERAELMRDFRAGRYQYLTNCMIATEGFDAPHVDMIIHGRPTLSRALYSQMTGRGTRTLPGLIDHLRDKHQAGDRRAAIASSSKPDCLLLDFVSNSGKHDLVTPEDLLGGKYTDEEVALAKKARRLGQGGDVRAELEKARSELRRLAAASSKARVTASVREFDPFRALGIHIADSKKYSTGWGNPIPTGLWDALVKKGVGEDELRKLSRGAAGKLYTELKRRTKENLCTVKQSRILMKYGVDPQTVTFERASEAIDYIASSGWRPDATQLHNLVTRQRESGED